MSRRRFVRIALECALCEHSATLLNRVCRRSRKDEGLAYRVAVDIGGTFTDLVVESAGGPSVSASHGLTTPARLAADGSVLSPVDAASVRAVALQLRDGGFEAVAVCLLHAYADGAHERRVGELLRALLDVPVVLSHVVAPVWREYERTATTVLSA